MENLSRRGFIGLLSAAAAVATGALPTLPALLQNPKLTQQLIARHTYTHVIDKAQILHRIDVWIGPEQYGVDLASTSKVLTPEEIEPAMTVLVDYIEHHTGQSITISLQPALAWS